MAEREVDVFVQVGSEEVLAGRLWSHRGRGTESQSFSYDRTYVARKDAYALDPQLPVGLGQFQTAVGRQIFGAFSDCAPDRWGRRLITRDEAKRVRREGGTARGFGEIDFLLGVRDDLRQGALRFRDPDGDVFLAPEATGVPSLIELPRLLGAAERVERKAETDEDLATLLRGGSSLGGARPKAHVLDNSGRIAIAKFPSPTTDEWDVIRWEAIALDLAAAAGLTVAETDLLEIGGKSVLVVDRFDRPEHQRIGYVSALTMLGVADGEKGSYLDIGEVITQRSPDTTRDLRELWRRIAFSVLISNFDDHLRNHGFLHAGHESWSLSPAFDLNPDPRPGERLLSTAIDFDDTAARIDLVMEVAEEFRLPRNAALAELKRVTEATGAWRKVARARGASDEEVDLMQPAFEHDARREAGDLVGPPT